MSQFRDRKKRIALAMGLASFFGAGRFSMAKGKPVKGNTEVSASNPNANKGFFTNLTTGKKIGMAAGGVGLAALTYEVIADTAGKNTGMPSIGKGFGWVKKQDDQKKDKKDDQKKDDQKDDQKKDKKDEPKKDEPKKEKPKKEVVVCSDLNKIIRDAYGNNIGQKLCVKIKSVEKKFVMKSLALIAHRVGITSKSWADKSVNKLDKFFVPVARAIGLSDTNKFSAGNIKELACHNFQQAQINVNNTNYTREEKEALLLITDIRNILNYQAGFGTKSDYMGGDLLKELREALAGIEKGQLA